jgi:hypothetical protein
MGTREKTLKNLLNFYFSLSDSGIDWQFRLEPASIPWKFKSGAQSAWASHRILRRKRRFPAFRFVHLTVIRGYFENEK